MVGWSFGQFVRWSEKPADDEEEGELNPQGEGEGVTDLLREIHIMKLDFILPVYNERENLRDMRDEIAEVIEQTDWFYRILFVDDGSNDGSTRLIRRMAASDPRIASIHFGENCGQSAAFAAGFEAASFPLVVTMDADGQNDPADVPKMVGRIQEYDLVAGYRSNREDTLLRRLGSGVANRVRNWVTGDNIIDTGCSLKVFRLEVVKSLPMFRGMHRFLPTLAKMKGYRVTQVPTHHRPRTKGRTKYTLSGRLMKTVWDLWAVRWMQKRRLDFTITETTNLPEETSK